MRSFESAESYASYMSNRSKTVLFCSSYMYNYFKRFAVVGLHFYFLGTNSNNNETECRAK